MSTFWIFDWCLIELGPTCSALINLNKTNCLNDAEAGWGFSPENMINHRQPLFVALLNSKCLTDMLEKDISLIPSSYWEEWSEFNVTHCYGHLLYWCIISKHTTNENSVDIYSGGPSWTLRSGWDDTFPRLISHLWVHCGSVQMVCLITQFRCAERRSFKF